MKLRLSSAAAFFALIVAAPLRADDKIDGFVPMFNGRDLTGWVNVNCAPSTFYGRDGEIITTGKPTGYLRTDKQYENFIAEFDWMHVPPAPGAVGNSGFFVWADPIPAVGTGYTRGIEVQVLVNLTYKDKKTGAVSATSQGDLFSIWGATCVPDRPHPLGWARCLPSEDRAHGANEWNHYRVEANDGTIKLAVNGKVVSGLSKCRPRKGYLALESEGSECHFRNLKIKGLPSTDPKPDEVADVAQGFHSLYDGMDLSGWDVDDAARQYWQPRDTVLHFNGKGTLKNNSLRSVKEYGDAEFIVDFRFPETGARPCMFGLRATEAKEAEIRLDPAHAEFLKPFGQWNRLQVAVRYHAPAGSRITLKLNGKQVQQEALPGSSLSSKAKWELQPEGSMDFANLFARELK
jgi:hypothetical protein